MYRLVTRYQFHVPGREFAEQVIHCHAPRKCNVRVAALLYCTGSLS